MATPLPPAWLCTALLGVGMLVSGVVAAIVAVTRVVLPYDEAFVGMTRAELQALSPDLLPFMTHDRVSLAGVMVSIGTLYAGLALGPIRAGQRWAWDAVRRSGMVGFLSFFLFLGFGYVDPLHAALALVLLPLFALGVGLRRPPPLPPAPVAGQAGDMRPRQQTDLRTRQLGMAARILFAAVGMGIIGAGSVIAVLGVTSVFVPSDLVFMQTTSDALRDPNTRVIPLIAHDRAGFGGALVSNGLLVLAIARRGIRAGDVGSRALWWTILLAGLAGYIPTLVVHVAVGYTDPLHLLPAVAGFATYLVALTLLVPYLLRQPRSNAT